ncbi:hypothetical protein D769_24013 [Cupriavidus sp. HMR-1]|nr:hypothetical protein D769_24013 [Cupriavidus sp. HMR-1]
MALVATMPRIARVVDARRRTGCVPGTPFSHFKVHMDGVIELFGWFVFNVALPLGAPLALLPLARVPSFFRAHRRGIVWHAIKGGQLLWAVIPMSASACHLLATALEVPGVSDALRPYIWFVMVIHVVVIVAASVLVLFATMDAHQRDVLAHSQAQRIPRSWIWLTCMSGGVHFVGYVALVRPHLPL